MSGWADIRDDAKIPLPVGMAAARSAMDRGDEGQLLIRHLEGEPEAFARLVESYRAPVYSYLVRCGVADEDRDDLFQEIFIRIHRAADQYRVDRPLHPWLFTIVANATRNYHRHNRVREIVFTDNPGADRRDSAPDGEQLVGAKQTREWLERQIRKLPLIQREVLILTCIERLPQKQVAEVLEIPVNTLKTHLRRARLVLMEKLARRNVRARDGASS
jgi:RNA polymerase sigma-70 factor (ECF subfamily)